MRYYIYLDIDFIKRLISTHKEYDFDIDYLSFSIQKNSCNIRNIKLEPRIEDMEPPLVGKPNEIKFDFNNSNSTTCEKKYVNISEITEVKRYELYDDIIKYLEKQNLDNEIVIEKGKIIQQANYKANQKIFLINNSYILYNQDILEEDIENISIMCDEISVIGFKIVDKKSENKRLIKALAIYIE